MMNRYPLLLKYKIRDCYFGRECDIDKNTNKPTEEWKGYYEKSKNKHWKLQYHNSRKFIRSKNSGFTRNFFRYEYNVAGSEFPIAVYFKEPEMLSANAGYERYKLPSNYYDYDTVNALYNLVTIYTILQEFEQHSDVWQTRVIVEREFEE